MIGLDIVNAPGGVVGAPGVDLTFRQFCRPVGVEYGVGPGVAFGKRGIPQIVLIIEMGFDVDQSRIVLRQTFSERGFRLRGVPPPTGLIVAGVGNQGAIESPGV